MSDNWSKVIAYSCTHHPIVDKKAEAWLFEQINEYKPDYVVHMGDLLDADSASGFPNEQNDWTLLEEYKSAAEHLNTVNRIVPNAQKIWLNGNHCSRLSAPNKLPAKLRDACSWKQNKDMEDALVGWKVIPYGHRELYRLGQVTFQHGAQANIHAERDQTLLYGVEYGLNLYGHTHKGKQIQQIVFSDKIPLNRYWANVGCLIDWNNLEYVRKCNIACWTHSCLKLRVNTNSYGHNWKSCQWRGEPGLVVLETAHNG